MKKTLFLSAICLVAVVCFFSSCAPEEQNFEESLLIGKWQSGTLFETYAANHTGTTWDTADDVTEAEAQSFTWQLDKSTLTQIHIMEMTGEGTIPKVYTVLTLNATTLTYEDDYGKKVTFSKVQ
ncbi:MAG: hypothetical protein ACI392_04400 [Paludibacteraceae bacterium]